MTDNIERVVREPGKVPVRYVTKIEEDPIEKIGRGIHWAFTHDLYADAKDAVLAKLGFSASKKDHMSVTDYQRQYSDGNRMPDLEDTGHVRVKKPLHKREWFKKTLFWGRRAAFITAAAAAGGLSYFADSNHDRSTGIIAKQEAGLERFLGSPEFEQFHKDFQNQMLWTMNYIAKEPVEAHSKLPEVAQQEQSQGKLDWSTYVMPITPKSFSSEALVKQERNISRLLSERGYRFDSQKRQAGKNLILNVASNAMRAYLQKHQEHNFGSIGIYEPLKDRLMKGLARKYGSGTTIYDIERMGSLYSTFGQAMIDDVNRERAKQAGIFKDSTKLSN